MELHHTDLLPVIEGPTYIGVLARASVLEDSWISPGGVVARGRLAVHVQGGERVEVILLNRDVIVLAAHLVGLGWVVWVVGPLVVHEELVLVLAGGQVDEGQEILLGLHHTDLLPVIEGPTE